MAPYQNQQKSLPRRQDDCPLVKEEFTTEEFLSELRTLTPAELERLIRSYAP
jgi:hypothetical protein